MIRSDKWMIYGAYGFTGAWIAREAVRQGLRPILAGRRTSPLEQLAGELGVVWRAFDLSQPGIINEALKDCRLILNCAGPFSRTAEAIVSACLETRTAYLDITGEIEVLDSIAQRHDMAAQRDVPLIPAVGFDVVPTDAMAVLLKQSLPSATSLALAFTGTGSLSFGTARTIIETCQKGSRIRKNGQIVTVPLGWKRRRVPFRSKRLWAMTVPWGDVATAWYSTGVRNIEVYLAMPLWAIILVRLFFPRRLHRSYQPDLRVMEPLVRRVMGLPPAGKATKKIDLWGCVTDDQGRSKTATMQTPDAYQVTVHTALTAVKILLESDIPGGFLTPTQAFGVDLALHTDGVDFRYEDNLVS